MEILAYIVMLAGLAVAIIGLLLYKLRLKEVSFIVLACFGVGVLIGWGDEITSVTFGKEGIKLEKETKRIADTAGQIPLSDLSEEIKSDAKQTAPEILSYEDKGNPLTAEMHSVLGLDAYGKGDMEEAARRWGIAALSGNNPDAYNNWGNALSESAEVKEEEKKEALFRESFGKYAEAVRIKPDKHEAYYNWGNALYELAKIKGDVALFRDSCAKYAEAARLKPDYREAYTNWGAALDDWDKIVKDDTEKEAFLKEAEDLYHKPQKESGTVAFLKWLLPWFIPMIVGAIIAIGGPIWLYSLGKKKAQKHREDVSKFPADGIPQGDKEDLELSAPEPRKQEEEGEPLTAEIKKRK